MPSPPLRNPVFTGLRTPFRSVRVRTRAAPRRSPDAGAPPPQHTGPDEIRRLLRTPVPLIPGLRPPSDHWLLRNVLAQVELFLIPRHFPFSGPFHHTAEIPPPSLRLRPAGRIMDGIRVIQAQSGSCATPVLWKCQDSLQTGQNQATQAGFTRPAIAAIGVTVYAVESETAVACVRCQMDSDSSPATEPAWCDSSVGQEPAIERSRQAPDRSANRGWTRLGQRWLQWPRGTRCRRTGRSAFLARFIVFNELKPKAHWVESARQKSLISQRFKIRQRMGGTAKPTAMRSTKRSGV